MALTNADIDKIAKRVWEAPVNGVRAQDRLAGIDSAANGALKLIRNGNLAKLYEWTKSLYDTWIARTDAAGSGMVDENGKEIRRAPYDRLVWCDKRGREINPHKTGEPAKLPIAVALSDEQMEQIADKVAKRMEGK